MASILLRGGKIFFHDSVLGFEKKSMIAQLLRIHIQCNYLSVITWRTAIATAAT